MFGKPKQRRREKQLQKTIQLFEQGVLTCEYCAGDMDLGALPPLTLAECNNCGMYTFVPKKIDRFWLVRPLGSGAMGRVYKAMCVDEPTQSCAVKLLPVEQQQDPELVASLKREAQLASLFGDHPCLVGCLAEGWDRNEPFYAMEYVDGVRLDNEVDHKGSLPVKLVCRLALDILYAEQHIYDEGYLYRDLKPQNVVLNQENHATLFDYGLCVPVEDLRGSVQSNIFTGSAYYMPPERWLGEPEDVCSEIYSLGLVMYYALAGRNFIRARDVENMVRRHVSYLRVPVTGKLVGFPDDITEVLSKMVQRDAGDRYQNFQQAAEAIEQVAAKR